MHFTAEETAERLRQIEKTAKLQATCKHLYTEPWQGCGYLQCKQCNHRIPNDD